MLPVFVNAFKGTRSVNALHGMRPMEQKRTELERIRNEYRTDIERTRERKLNEYVTRSVQRSLLG